jgi:hypothetical protein
MNFLAADVDISVQSAPIVSAKVLFLLRLSLSDELFSYKMEKFCNDACSWIAAGNATYCYMLVILYNFTFPC